MLTSLRLKPLRLCVSCDSRNSTNMQLAKKDFNAKRLLCFVGLTMLLELDQWRLSKATVGLPRWGSDRGNDWPQLKTQSVPRSKHTQSRL